MYMYHCHNTKYVHVQLGTANINAYFQDIALRGCFAGSPIWSFQTCQPAKRQRCGNLKLCSSYCRNLTRLDDSGEHCTGYQNIHSPFSWYEHVQFRNAVISTLYRPVLHIHLLWTSQYLQFLRIFIYLIIHPFYIRLFDAKLREDDLKKIVTFRSINELYVKVYFLVLPRLVVLTVKLFFTALTWIPLTFSRLMTCIYIYIYMSYRTANLQMLHFVYLFNKYTYWIF